MKTKLSYKNFLKQSLKRLASFAHSSQGNSFCLAALPILWIVLFFIIPTLIIFKVSFSESVFSAPPFTDIFSCSSSGFINIKLNLQNYINLFKDSYYFNAFINSIILSSVSTILCLIIGFMMAYGLHKFRYKTKIILLLLISLSFWVAFLVRIYAWINFFSYNGFINHMLIKIGIINTPIQFVGNYYSVCLGMVFCYLPFMILPIHSSLEKLDKSYIEAAYDLGCSPTKTFWQVTVPLAKYGVAAGCLLVFSTSIGEFAIPELLGGPDTLTFGRVLWNEFFTNIDWPIACALSVVMMILILTPIIAFRKYTKFS